MKYDKVFDALGNPIRLQLLERLRDRPGGTLSEIIQGLKGTRQGLSRHLEVLEEAGLIAIRWDGREKLHYFNPVPLAEIRDEWFPEFVSPEAVALKEIQKQLERRALERRRGRRA